MPEETKKKTYGGMAVVEGVMMRSPNHYSVACRAPNGKIFVKTEPIEKTWIGRQKWLLKPFLRGTFALLDTMGLGMRAMRIAGDVQMDPKFQPGEGETVHPEKEKETEKSRLKRGRIRRWLSSLATRLQLNYERNQAACDKVILGVTLIVSLVIGFLIFNVFPNFAGQYIAEFGQRIGVEPQGNERGMFTSVLVETIKLAMFIGYVALIRRYPAILDVFRYHGAEHQAINAMEAGVDLTPENCLRQTRLHPRCGTNFAIIVFIIGFLLFPLVPRDLVVSGDSPSWLIALTRLPVEIALLPIVAGISYEIIRIAGKFKNETWVNVVLWPGLKTQLITTAEPEARHAEVAIAALEAAVRAEETGELTNTDDYDARELDAHDEPDAPDEHVDSSAKHADLANEA